MKSKRILGVVFIILALVMTLAIVGQLPSLFAALFGFFELLTRHLSSFQAGEVFGRLFYWILHFAATIALWIYGIRWSGKQVKAKQ